MKRQRLISEGSISRTMHAAMERWNRQEYDQYFEMMERASRMDPANHGLLLELGSAHGRRYDYAAAEECFEKAARIAPRKSEALAMAGVHCRGFNHYPMARHYFELAIAEKDASPDALVKLAELYERFRFLNEAADLVNRALQMDSGLVLALLVRARLERLAGRLTEAEAIVRPFLDRTDPDTWSTRIRGWYELGAILDAQGRFDEAMAAFLHAKMMIRPNAQPRIAAQKEAHARLKEAESDITSAVMQRWFEAGRQMTPVRRLALLGGHPRSGTTLLEQVLDSHPDMLSAEETSIFYEEVYFALQRGFPDGTRMLTSLDAAAPAVLARRREAYFSCMEKILEKPIADRCLIDKNPSLTGLIPAVARVFPEAKFLVALRDPRDVCLSCFMQPLPLNQVSSMFLDLDTTVQEYSAVMGLWRAISARLPNPWMEVRYEDMVDDLEGTSRKVLDFLGVPWDERVLRFNEHARQKLVRSPTYADVAKPVFKGAVGRWRNYQKFLEPWLESLTPFAKAFGYE
jgi:tetratricopeptide (TPR) repeat protein